MIPPIPLLDDYELSPHYGFLPMELPLEVLPDPYYNRWEAVTRNLQALLLSGRLRGVVDRLPVLLTSRLQHAAEWRRAYHILAFVAHAYIWGGDKPAERVPPPISIPFLKICKYLELPPVATYAGVCLWNFKPIFPDEPMDTLDNLSTLATFTGSLDESWFYLVSVAIEARGAPILPLMLNAIAAARVNDSRTVTECLHTFAETLDELGTLLQRMYENCDPHVFYHRIRPFLAGSKNMADAGLPNGVIFEDGSGQDTYRQYGGGSNAQSSLIQFFDIVLGVEHRPTGEKKNDSSESEYEGTAPPPRHNFIQDMRSYMPGPHRRFLEHVSNAANIREFVETHRTNRALSIAYDACLAMLRSLRDKHIQMVSRYIIVKSRESRSHSRSLSPRAAPQPINLATAMKNNCRDNRPGSKKLRGTGGTALIPFLKQARDETGEPAIDAWARRLLSNGPGDGGANFAALGKMGEHADGEMEIVGLAGTWAMDDSEGGICHW
ncbi:MAG: indoleamine 2 [Lasallia pustulata]|uniref:Indoleamine 2,3-dioxygenase n=1 Tax=Lasallia pustulata TaxID=136370 RepID=A0A1W5CYZ3_9LECA|nr:MAG: indoleamine 2 [Lasallia pustulata]SLM36066.1 indoleamine-dioxygenase subfamily [Lasallia pustulata]